MSDLISSDEAKSLLGCDDATLQNYINNGTLRAQRVDGELMLQRDDVENLGATNPTTDSDDGTIILSGDSEDLSIDLGEVVDDGAQTVVEQAPVGDDSLTFGDELESVNFDDGGTQELSFDDAEATQDGLSFTDSNTAVNTDVDETVVGTATATATDDFQTVDYGEETDEGQRPSAGSVRRSVRSQRVRQAAPKVHWIWPSCLILTLVVAAFFCLPYPFMSIIPQSADETYANGDRKRGATDNLWTDIAGGLAGFAPEPDRDVYMATHPDGQWVSIGDSGDPLQSGAWRHEQYRGDKSSEERAAEFIISDIDQQEQDGEPVPTAAHSQTENGNTLLTFPVQSKSEMVGPDEGETVTEYVPVGKWR